jgi:O-antigen ligase
MTETIRVDRRHHILAGVILGIYAATITLARSPAVALTLAAPLLLIPAAWWLLLAPARWTLVFLFSALLLPPLPIAIGNSGPHLAVMVAAFGILIGVIRLRDWRFRFDLLPVSLLLFCAILLASVACAAVYSGPDIAAASLARLLLFGVSIYLLFYCAYGPGTLDRSDSFSSFRILYWIAVASALFGCIDFYYQLPAPAGYGAQFVWLDSGVYRRAQGFFYEASTLGNFCAFFLLVIAVALIRPRREGPLSRWSLLCGGAVFTTALVFSYSRASVLNVLTGLTALLWLHRDRIKWRRVLLVLVSSAGAGILIVYAIFPSFAAAYWFRLSASVQYLFSATEGVLSGRLASWRMLATFLIEHPWHMFLGVGYKTLPYSDYIGQATAPDNMYLSLLVETGVLGLAAMLLMSAAILRDSLRAARSGDTRASFFGASVFCFWTGQMVQMLSGDLLTYWRVLPVYFWALAIAVRR